MKTTQSSNIVPSARQSKASTGKSKSYAMGMRICDQIGFDPADPTVVASLTRTRSATFRSLAQYMTRAYQQDTGSTVMPNLNETASAATTETYLSQLTQLNDRLDKPIQVHGAIQQMTYMDWIAVEQALTKSEMARINARPEGGTGSGVCLTALVSQLKASYTAFPHYLLYSVEGLLGAMLCIGILPMLLSMVASMVSLSEKGILTLFIVLAVLGGAVASIFLTRRASQCNRVIQEDISDTWEDVFEIKSAADAILLGSIRDILDTFHQLRETPPDFMSVSPRQAMLVIEHYFTEQVRTDDSVLRLVKTFKKDCHKYNISYAAPSVEHLNPLLVQSFQVDSQVLNSSTDTNLDMATAPLATPASNSAANMPL